MLPSFLSPLADRDVIAARPSKAVVDPWRPVAFHVEDERQDNGIDEAVATVFLTNRECRFRCVMCDLWKHTTNETVAVGAIPAQVDYALDRLPPAQHIKLYNSGNFFDPATIREADYQAIADRIAKFRTVIVENHARLVNDRVLRFNECLQQASAQQTPQLEVAMGLETIHPTAFAFLNKQFDFADIARACKFLMRNSIRIRVFVLLNPPTLFGDASIDWTVRSVEFAFRHGANVVTIIPTRAGNGIMERLQAERLFEPPTLSALEQAFARSQAIASGRLLVDLWDAERLFGSEPQATLRIERLRMGAVANVET